VSTSRVLFDVAGDGSVAYITFNRPEARNAMTSEMYAALVAACERIDADAAPAGAIRAAVLRGAGGTFVSGTDIAQFQGFSTRADGIAYERELDRVIDRLERVVVPTIAQVQGVAAGGGCAIALACDLRVCTSDAAFGVPIARTLGNCLSFANYARLVDLIGPARVKDLLFTGRLVKADEAMTLGLVNRLADAATIDAAVHEVAATMAANAPLTIRATKEAVRRIQASRRPEAAEAEDLIAMCYLSTDFKEGVAAFLEKRKPRFEGR
jgi:enoyl-CoA hydratase/carnithine racemase